MKRLLLIIGVGFVVLLALRRRALRRHVEVLPPPPLWEGRAPQPVAAPVAPAPPRPTTRPRWLPPIVAVWVFIFGVFVGGAAIPHVNDRPSLAAPSPAPPTLMSPAVHARNLAWPPAAGATSYRLGFYQDGRRVYGEEAIETHSTVSLPAGEYLWVVWPVHGQTVATTAIVTAQLHM